MGLGCCPRSNTLRSDGPLFPALIGGAYERDLRDHLRCGVGFSRDHPIPCRRNVDNAANMKRVCQGLIVLIAILSVIGVLLGSAPPPASHVGPLAPNSPSNPSVVR
jgi:hypothetical protein